MRLSSNYQQQNDLETMTNRMKSTKIAPVEVNTPPTPSTTPPMRLPPLDLSPRYTMSNDEDGLDTRPVCFVNHFKNVCPIKVRISLRIWFK